VHASTRLMNAGLSVARYAIVHVHLSNAITRIDDTRQPQPIASCSALTIRGAQLTLCLVLRARRSIDQVWNEGGMMLASTARLE
jgi:hypothetical protein